jgi:hypothetical protein
MAGQLQVTFSPILVILLIIFVALFAIYVYQNGVVADVAKKSEGMSEEFREGAYKPGGAHITGQATGRRPATRR